MACSLILRFWEAVWTPTSENDDDDDFDDDDDDDDDDDFDDDDFYDFYDDEDDVWTPTSETFISIQPIYLKLHLKPSHKLLDFKSGRQPLKH